MKSALRASVRSFFAGGGRRCWAVRVAGRGAETSRFEIPGLLAVDGGAPAPACAWARSPGSWADGVTAGSALLARSITVEQLHQHADTEVTLLAVVPAGQPVTAGDLVRVALPARALLCFVHVRAITPSGRAELGERLAITGTPFWFATPASVGPRAVTALGRPAVVANTGASPEWELHIDAATLPEEGSLVPLRDGSRAFFLHVDQASKVASGPAASVRVRGACFEWLGSPFLAGAGPQALNTPGEVLAMELWARRPGRAPQRMTALGLCPEHPRYWRALPSDDRLFLARLRGEQDLPETDLSSGQACGARFPLAGEPGAPGPGGEAVPSASAVYLPVGMPPSPVCFLPALRSARDEAERDGLDRLPAGAFLDEDVTRPGSAVADTARSLLAWAEYRQYTAPGHERRHLQGIFAAFGVPEVSLLAVPDALHSDWHVSGARLPPAFEPPVRGAGGALTLLWRADEPASARYVVEERRPDGTTRALPATEPRLEIPPGQPAGQYRYRVRPEGSGASWSAPLSVAIEEPQAGAVFDTCTVLARPEIACDPEVPEGTPFEIRWALPSGDTAGVLAPDRYVVEEAADPGFMRTAVLYEGPGSSIAGGAGVARLTAQGRSAGDVYYRLRSERALMSAVSTGVLVRVRPRRGRVEVADSGEVSATALRIHEHALRLCAARADVLAVLALPARYREDAALRHVAALLDRFGESEPATLSYGAVYHPWLVSSEGRGELRAVPPDGAACGLLARTAVSRGAWIAAANQPFGGVLGLEPPLLDHRTGELSAAQINVVLRDPRGFLVKSEDTLAVVPELLPIHARRLLVLLRRAALELGASFAFEPNGPALERMVERAFSGMLRRLHEQGAFSGAREASAFQVRVAGGAASRGAADGARFEVEIAVAPAGSIEVITVRLVQTGALGAVVEGA